MYMSTLQMSFHSQAAEVKERMDMDDEERRGMLHILERSIIMSAQIFVFSGLLNLFPTCRVLFKILCCKSQTFKQFGFMW